ncbi:MAG: hypothetical protein SGARI_005515 [Bacillariaceae sp.]
MGHESFLDLESKVDGVNGIVEGKMKGVAFRHYLVSIELAAVLSDDVVVEYECHVHGCVIRFPQCRAPLDIGKDDGCVSFWGAAVLTAARKTV